MEEQPTASGDLKSSLPQELQQEIDGIAAQLPRVTANPADLDDNQKRWLIVGICLHSVISPVLRTYVVPILTVLYNELIQYQKIDTQTYQTHLKRYPPTNNVWLNYEAVNNNKATYGKQKAKYDYTIKSVVDLSKLFLQPYMAHYTGFDDTCDSSAVLGLIVEIDRFLPVVKLKAEDIRRNIRNPWAHCNFTEWDAVKYKDSFQLMEKLIKDLSLSSTEEQQAIGEIQKWKLNGQHFLSGTTLGLELVNDIRQQTHVLAEYTKLVATETDHNSMRINQVLVNVDILLNTLTELKKDMKTGFSEINKRLLAKEENHDTLLDSQKDEIDFWKEQEVTFVDTPVVNVILEVLESEHNVLIVGEPGIGKSILLHHVSLKLQKKIDFDIIPCFGMQDIMHQHKAAKRQMFVLDDIFGRFTVSMSDMEMWVKNEDKLKRILKRGNTIIAATCRLDICKDDKFQESCTVFKSNIFNLSVEYSMEDKLKICKNYLTKTDIQLLRDQNVDFTPLMCYLYSKNENFNLTDFLECPFEIYQKEWDKLKSFDQHKYCSLFLFVIYNGIMEDSLFDMHDENNTKNKLIWENIFDICEINRGTPRTKIQTVLDSMIGTYVRKTRNEYTVIHDKMFDFLCCYFGNKKTMVSCILRYSDIRVFNQRTQLESINEQHGKCTIMISKEHEQEYFERVKSDLLLGKMNQCFYNTQMKYEAYRTSFIKISKSIDDILLIAQIYKRKKMLMDKFITDAMECKDRSGDANDDDNDDTEDNDDNDDAEDHDDSDDAEDHDDSDDAEDHDDDDDAEDDDYFDEGPFIKSCLRGYLDISQYFISKSVNIKNFYSFHTPLTAASKGGNEKIVQLLIDKGCKVNQADCFGQTPLTVACGEGNEKIVQLLIDKGSKVNQEGGMGQTPLTVVCKRGHDKIVQTLIDKGSSINKSDCLGQTPLTAACHGGNEKTVQLLIEKGSALNQIDGKGQTPLTTTCKGGNEKLVHLLIDKGSDVNKVDGKGQTPLTTACKGGNEKIVQFLIDKGSDVNPLDGENQTPLIAACSEGNGNKVQLLKDKGRDNKLVDGMNSKQTPLTAACSGGNEKIVQLLIDKGSDVNQVDFMGETPLTTACRGGSGRNAPFKFFLKKIEKIVELFLDTGGDVNKASADGATPLRTSSDKENEKIVKLLIDKGCDVNKTNGYGETPLTISRKRRNKKIFQILLDKEKEVNQV